METKKLSSQESLELIAQMIQNTKQNLDNRSGNVLIIWGVTTLLVTLLVGFMLYIFDNNQLYNWLFMMIPIIGTIWSRLSIYKNQKVITQVDKIVEKVWYIITFVAISIPILFALLLIIGVDFFPIFSHGRIFMLVPFIEIMVVSIGLAITGAIIDFKASQIGGIVGVILSVGTLLADLPYGGALSVLALWL